MAGETLPITSWDAFARRSKHEAFVAIVGMLDDVTKFKDDDAGGRALSRNAVGRDATTMFHGGISSPSLPAGNTLATLTRWR